MQIIWIFPPSCGAKRIEANCSVSQRNDNLTKYVNCPPLKFLDRDLNKLEPARLFGQQTDTKCYNLAKWLRGHGDLRLLTSSAVLEPYFRRGGYG